MTRLRHYAPVDACPQMFVEEEGEDFASSVN